jgi:hypothetical protein
VAIDLRFQYRREIAGQDHKSVRRPIRCPSDDERDTVTRLGWPVRAMLLDVIAIIIWGKPV